VADEGGWGPRLSSNEEALQILTAAIERAGYRPSDQVSIAIDVAASHFFRGGLYELTSEGRTLTAAGMVDQLESWCGRFPVISVEDGLDQDDWSGWQLLTCRLGGHLQLIGDDLFATNPTRLARGITDAAATSVLVKMNQIGTLTETFLVIDQARAAGLSARARRRIPFLRTWRWPPAAVRSRSARSRAPSGWRSTIGCSK
jgi:enolase